MTINFHKTNDISISFVDDVIIKSLQEEQENLHLFVEISCRVIGILLIVYKIFTLSSVDILFIKCYL